jgi:uncharacterized membrane protein
MWVFLGQFHPLVLHLPIGILFVVVLLEVKALGRWDKSHTTMPLIVSAVSAVAAVILGYILMSAEDYSSGVMKLHLWSGVAFAITLVWAVFFKMRYNVTGRGQKKYGVFLGVSVFLMLVTGHYGGVITHGDPFDKAPWNQKTSGSVTGETLSERLVYEDVVVPILEAKCYSCHGSKKKKGHLRMDSYELMLEGGEEGECLVPGDVVKSLMIERMCLPKDHEDVMPPEEKPQLSPGEVLIVKWWVQIGAPRKTKLSDLTPPSDVQVALEDEAE